MRSCPAAFGPLSGFRFDLQFTTDALEMRGIALAARHNDRLDVMLFSAPDEYYFGKYSPVVEQLFSSVALGSGK